MAYGFAVRNPSGELIVDSDARGVYCIGRASLISVGTYAPPAGASFTTSWASAVYRISSPRPIIIAHELMSGYTCGIAGIIESSPGVYDIRAFNSNALDGEGVPTTFTDFAIWAFSELSTTPSGFGMVLYKSDGITPAWDLTHPYPLFPRQFFNVTSGASASIVSLTKPALLGPQRSWQRTLSNAGVNRWRRRTLYGAHRLVGTTLNVTTALSAATTFTAEDPDTDPDGDVFPSSSFILEGAQLP